MSVVENLLCLSIIICVNMRRDKITKYFFKSEINYFICHPPLSRVFFFLTYLCHMYDYTSSKHVKPSFSPFVDIVFVVVVLFKASNDFFCCVVLCSSRVDN